MQSSLIMGMAGQDCVFVADARTLLQGYIDLSAGVKSHEGALDQQITSVDVQHSSRACAAHLVAQ